MFSCLCGKSAYPNIVLGTTKWPEKTRGRQSDQLESRLIRLENTQWKDLIRLGSKTYRIDTTQSALQLVRSILDKLELTAEAGELKLQIQKEVVDKGKAVPKTKAGKILGMDSEGRFNWNRLFLNIEEEKLEEMDRELAELAIKKNKFSHGLRRVATVF